MLNIAKETVIYVVCPAYNKTGGTELAHQLVYAINANGLNAVITYYENGQNPMEINPAFKEYVNTFVRIENVEDLDRNIIVVPEACFRYGMNLKNIQKCIWWMSVDNYTKWHHFGTACHYFGWKAAAKGFLKKRLSLSLYPHFDDEIIHFYQSEYARSFLENAGITKVYRLSDYLNEEYLNVDLCMERQNVVLYNPRKGIKFSQKLMKAAPDIQWKPLQNMTTEEVKNTLLHSKVYIDFGNHPGKDRFPREAAMCGCCVITGKRGSAKYFADVPIADEFKFDESRKTIGPIIAKIRECLENYVDETPKFNKYRAFIRDEHRTFVDDVKKIFSFQK